MSVCRLEGLKFCAKAELEMSLMSKQHKQAQVQHDQISCNTMKSVTLGGFT